MRRPTPDEWQWLRDTVRHWADLRDVGATIDTERLADDVGQLTAQFGVDLPTAWGAVGRILEGIIHDVTSGKP